MFLFISYLDKHFISFIFPPPSRIETEYLLPVLTMYDLKEQRWTSISSTIHFIQHSIKLQLKSIFIHFGTCPSPAAVGIRESLSGCSWKGPLQIIQANPAQGRVIYRRPLKVSLRMPLNTFMKGCSTTSLGNPFQCFTTLTVFFYYYFILFKRNFLVSNLFPLPLVKSRSTSLFKSTL